MTHESDRNNRLRNAGGPVSEAPAKQGASNTSMDVDVLTLGFAAGLRADRLLQLINKVRSDSHDGKDNI
jgi:hypothetical protein